MRPAVDPQRESPEAAQRRAREALERAAAGTPEVRAAAWRATSLIKPLPGTTVLPGSLDDGWAGL